MLGVHTHNGGLHDLGTIGGRVMGSGVSRTGEAVMLDITRAISEGL